MGLKDIKVISIINEKTGEVRQKRTYIDSVFDEDKGLIFFANKSYVRSFIDAPFPEEFTWAEQGKLSRLKHMILRENQLLVYRGSENGVSCIKPLGIKELQRIWKVKERQASNLVRKAKQYGILREVSIDGITYLAYNPIYGTKGKRITVTTYMIFQKELKKMLPSWAVEKFARLANDLGPFLKVID